MTTTATSTPQPPVPPPTTAGQRRARLTVRAKIYLSLMLLMAPTIIGMIIFNYYPKFDAIRYSFYEWDGSFKEEFIRWQNYIKVWNDVDFWSAFRLVMILFVSNLVKMWPCIFAAVVLHRLHSGRARYIYQVLFVIPMVIPWLVQLLIWKAFYNPNYGPLNQFLNFTGGMELLAWTDKHAPATADALTPVRTGLDYAFGNPFGILLLAMCVMLAGVGVRIQHGRRWFAWLLALVLGTWLVGPSADVPGTEIVIGGSFSVPFSYYALPLMAVGAGLGLGLRAIGSGGINDVNRDRLPKMVGTVLLIAGSVLVTLTMVWTEPTGSFDSGRPAWLGDHNLVVPAVIFWGFPWVGTIGVLLYLAALQGISDDVYEAAELDGVTWWGKFVHIELPLMLTMVRINLIFMTINVLNTYGLFYILLGVNGGPKGAGDVPGLVMFREAFQNVNFGLACSMGMYLFVMILILTIIYQKYVRVEK